MGDDEVDRNIEREVLAAALLGYWGRPRNGRHGPADWTPRQYEVMAEALEASGLPEQLRGALEERDRYWQALMDIAGHENWEPKAMGDIARAALDPPSGGQ